ncbi:hypothetical protein EON64_18465 [archaeon]|nr:MAG: hypothetical protein EON64_18465 [archaeon]
MATRRPRGCTRCAMVRGQVFEDVPRTIAHLVQTRGLRVAIYSSGSRQAQQLIFRHTAYGDLTQHLSAYFDTKVGAKGDSASYTDIALTLGAQADKVLFVTDMLVEAKAAAAAGLSVLLSSRPGNAPITEEHGFQVITSFEQIVV